MHAWAIAMEAMRPVVACPALHTEEALGGVAPPPPGGNGSGTAGIHDLGVWGEGADPLTGGGVDGELCMRSEEGLCGLLNWHAPAHMAAAATPPSGQPGMHAALVYCCRCPAMLHGCRIHHAYMALLLPPPTLGSMSIRTALATYDAWLPC